MIFPYDNVDMGKQLDALSNGKHDNGVPFIHRYEVDGAKYIQIVTWDKHQKPHHTEADSKIPPPKEKENPPIPLKEKELGMGMGMEKQLNPSCELRNGEITVKIQKQSELFEIFWDSYPKKKNKGDAEKAWLKIKPSTELQQKISNAVKQGKQSADWLKDHGKYIPYPATWLNAKGWEDEFKGPEIENDYQLVKPDPEYDAMLKSVGKSFEVIHEPKARSNG